jgi:hypothetical protein
MKDDLKKALERAASEYAASYTLVRKSEETETRYACDEVHANGTLVDTWNDDAASDHPEDLIWSRDISSCYMAAGKHGFKAGAAYMHARMAKEVDRLTRIIAKELTENDELGCEFTYVNALKAEIEALKNCIQALRLDNDELLTKYYDHSALLLDQRQLQTRIASLEAKLQIATEALEWIGDGGCSDVECWDKASHALAELKK